MTPNNTIQVDIPACRDPFINTQLISLGKNAQGLEHFWISSWNSASGSTGVLIDENGGERIYRFAMPHAGFYSAVQEDDDTLWLCGNLSRLVRLTLSSGEYEVFETGLPPVLMFSGMVIDREQGKLFAVAFPGKVAAFSFDYRKRHIVELYDDVYHGTEIIPEKQARYMRHHFSHTDGTFNVVLMIPEAVLLRWNPSNETVTPLPLSDVYPEAWAQNQSHLDKYFYGDLSFITGERADEYYFPYLGWFDAGTNQPIDGPKPSQEMKWFARRGHLVWGWTTDYNQTTVALWDMKDGSVQTICNIPDCKGAGIALSEANKIVAVTIYGQFLRHDAFTGELEVTRWLPTESVGAVDCLCRIDEERLLGTPFITQRFWELNLKTNQGVDCGRAAPGVGEVLLTWNINQRVYMASYTQGILTEYDPARPTGFPDNPRIVAQSPHGMRPVAGARNGDVLFYSCTHRSGLLGCELTRYDTATGEALYKDDPLPGLCVHRWHYDQARDCLIAGTTIQADCRSCPPTESQSAWVKIDPVTLEVVERKAPPESAWQALVHGQVNENNYLAETCHDNGDRLWHLLDADTLEATPFRNALLQDGQFKTLQYTGRTGLFICHVSNRFELWDMKRIEKLSLIYEGDDVHCYFVQDEAYYFVTPKKIIVKEVKN